jgi:hypothetical protein
MCEELVALAGQVTLVVSVRQSFLEFQFSASRDVGSEKLHEADQFFVSMHPRYKPTGAFCKAIADARGELMPALCTGKRAAFEILSPRNHVCAGH